MKSELWSKVKRGDYLIYADEYDGVQKAKVTEIDISIEIFEPEYKKEQPWGLTAETGYVRIKVGEIEIVQNLASLIRFVPSWHDELLRSYKKYEYHKALAEAATEAFTSLRAKYREA